jgi:DHA2 family multidrug resistance protein
MLARRSQVHQQFLVAHVYNGAAAWSVRFQALTQQGLTHTPSVADAQHHALAMFYSTVLAQAGVLSYIDIVQSLAIFCACMVPLAVLMKKPPKGMHAAAH